MLILMDLQLKCWQQERVLLFQKISGGDIVAESKYDDETVRWMMERTTSIRQLYIEQKFTKKQEKAATARMKGYEDMIVKEHDFLFYQRDN